MKRKGSKGQMSLFPEADKPSAKKMAQEIISKRLAFETHKGRSGRTKNVRNMLVLAFTELERHQGIDYAELKRAMRHAQKLSAEVFWNRAVEKMERGSAETKKIMQALKIIAQAGNWRRVQHDFARTYSPGPDELAEMRKERRHLEDIKREGET